MRPPVPVLHDLPAEPANAVGSKDPCRDANHLHLMYWTAGGCRWTEIKMITMPLWPHSLQKALWSHLQLQPHHMFSDPKAAQEIDGEISMRRSEIFSACLKLIAFCPHREQVWRGNIWLENKTCHVHWSKAWCKTRRHLPIKPSFGQSTSPLHSHSNAFNMNWIAIENSLTGSHYSHTV